MSSSLRPVSPDDEEFLFQVYASTRAEEMALVPWDAAQKQSFLQMQFNAQRESYQREFPRAKYEVILRDDVPAGRLIVDRSDEAIMILDVALLPEHRRAGIGTKLIRDLQFEAQESQRGLRLHVENFNPAFRLYERLGFTKIEETGFYWLMEWRKHD